MLSDLWRIVGRLAFALGIILTFFVALELFRAFVFFYRMAPVMGWAFLGIGAALALTLLVYVGKTISAYPRTLKAPALPPLEEASFVELRRYCRYLGRYLERLARNPLFDEAAALRAGQQVALLRETLGAHPLKDDLRRAIQQTEAEHIEPLLAQLRERARKEVRRSVRDVMLGVSLSPYHSLDVVIVLYRNAAMVLRLAGIYASRPNSREQWLVLRDVLRVVVTVNFLYIGRNLLENLFANVPVIGRVVDDIGQGLGAGLFTSAAGHAAIDRCTAFQGWNKEAAVDSLASQTKAFLVDVKDIFTRDVLPDLRGRLRTEVGPDATEEPALWEAVAAGIATAIDRTAGMMENLVIKPALAGGRTVVGAGSAVRRQLAGEREEPSRRRRHRRRRRTFNLFGTVGQRLRYGLRPPRD